MWFKNIKTGVEWDISDTEHINRLKLDKDYQETEKAITEDNVILEKKAAKAKTPTQIGG